MNDPDFKPSLYTSMPLAEAQRREAESEDAASDAPDRSHRAAPAPRSAEAAEQDYAPPARRRAMPTVDFEFDQLPEQHFEDFAFTIPPVTGDIVYVLGIDDDNELVELIDTFHEESALGTIIEEFFDATFKYALNPDGTEVEGSEKFFFDVIGTEPKSGQMVPRKKLMDMIAEAVDKWSGELTDTSMRPNRRARRARRR